MCLSRFDKLRADRHREAILILDDQRFGKRQKNLRLSSTLQLPASGSNVTIGYKDALDPSCGGRALISDNGPLEVTTIEEDEQQGSGGNVRRFTRKMLEAGQSVSTLFLVLDWSPCRQDAGPATTVQVRASSVKSLLFAVQPTASLLNPKPKPKPYPTTPLHPDRVCRRPFSGSSSARVPLP